MEDQLDISLKSYACQVCQKRFSQCYFLKQQMRMSGQCGKKPYTCDVCHKRVYQSCHLSHLHIDTDEKLYECHICHNGIHVCEHQKKHMQTHTCEKPHSCNVCHKGFLGPHIRNHISVSTHVRSHMSIMLVTSNLIKQHTWRDT